MARPWQQQPCLPLPASLLSTRMGCGSPCLQCQGVLPSETLPDGTKPPQKWNHYQFWWQTIMTKAAPELRAMGWNNLKCALLPTCFVLFWLSAPQSKRVLLLLLLL